MNTKRHWVSTKLNPDKQILAQNVTVRDATGLKIEANLEIEDINPKGELEVSAHYNSSTHGIALTKFYLTQEQMGAFEKDPLHCVLDVHDPVSGLQMHK